MDRQARVAGGAETIEHLAQRRIERERDDVGARHHHVLDPDVVQGEHILEDGALLRGELLARASSSASSMSSRTEAGPRPNSARRRSNSPEGCSREPLAGAVSGAGSPSFRLFHASTTSRA